MEIRNGQFWLGNCLDLMSIIPNGSVDMILCDLPYGTTHNKWDKVIPFEPLWEQYWRIAKPNAAIVLTAQCPFDKVLGISQIDFLRYEWIWRKNAITGFLNAKKMPLKNCENILVFYKKLPTYNPQMTSGKPYVATAGTNSKNYGPGLNNRLTINNGERYPVSCIDFARDKEKIHPTQKPVALFEYLIKTYTNEGETVLDNCAGSGTTAVACENTNRKWICIEKEPEYYYPACLRVAGSVR